MELANSMENTFSGTVSYLCRKGLEKVEQERIDKEAGEAMRLSGVRARKAASA